MSVIVRNISKASVVELAKILASENREVSGLNPDWDNIFRNKSFLFELKERIIYTRDYPNVSDRDY